jgi:hypothetical protein
MTDSMPSYLAAEPPPLANCSVRAIHPVVKHLSVAYSVAAEHLAVMCLLKVRLVKTHPAVVSRWRCQDAAHCFPAAVSHSPQQGCFVLPKTERSCLPRLTAAAELRERC